METNMLSEEQLDAVQLCLDKEKRIVSITGQAGTGKTTILKHAFASLSESGYSIALVAPTGKAAKRITEATGIPASTIHRYLEFSNPGKVDEHTGKPQGISTPSRNKHRNVDEDFVFVDESSMVTKELWRDLIDAIGLKTNIRFFGDVNQLPPIEAGADFGKKIESPFEHAIKTFPTKKLTQIFRQGEGSGIVLNGDRIIHGIMPLRRDDFELVISNEPEKRLFDVIEDCFKEGIDFSDLKNQIIIPTKQGSIGTNGMNPLLQKKFHELRRITTPKIRLPRHSWDKLKKTDTNARSIYITEFDKVINTKNVYATQNTSYEVMNGESGIIENIYKDDDGEACITINLGDRIVECPSDIVSYSKTGQTFHNDPRKELDLAYAITTHKSQGSEYDYIIYYITRSMIYTLNRANLYTAITRAKKKCIIICDSSSGHKKNGLELTLSKLG